MRCHWTNDSIDGAPSPGQLVSAIPVIHVHFLVEAFLYIQCSYLPGLPVLSCLYEALWDLSFTRQSNLISQILAAVEAVGFILLLVRIALEIF